MSLTNVIDYLRGNFTELEITLRPGASEDLIQKVEEIYNIVLPQDIKQFYRFSNGFDTYDWIFNLIPMEEMIEQKIKYNEPLSLAEYLIYSETWHLKVDEDDHDSYSITISDGKDDVILTDSLAEFIQRFLKGGLHGEDGLCHWPSQL